MEWKNIKLEQDNGIWTLTINRPEMRNALDAPTVKEFREALGSLDTGKAGVLILTGFAASRRQRKPSRSPSKWDNRWARRPSW